MAIPKKGTRKIVVDGVAYRWYIRRNGDYHGALTVAVELAANDSASILVVDFHTPRPGSFTALFYGYPKISITPKDVVTHIRAALAAGWNPLQPGSPFIYLPDVPPTETSKHSRK